MDIKERVEKLKGFTSSITGRLVIVIAQVDPDALGSAFGLAFIVKALSKVNVQIIFAGQIDFEQNKEIVRRFGLMNRMVCVKDYKYQKDDVFALVDSSSVDDCRIPELCDLFKDNQPRLVIDHHLDCKLIEDNSNFIWVDTGSASASTMVVELIEELGYSFAEYDKYIAIMLAIGIYTDSKSLIACSRRDVCAYGGMTDNVSYQEIAPVLNYPLSRSYYDNLKRALNSWSENSRRLVAGLGFIKEDCGSHVAILADQLIRDENTSLVIVWAIVGTTVRLSARTRDIRFPLDEFLKERFPGSGSKVAPDGHGEGGGMLTLPLEHWLTDSTKPIVEQLVAKFLEEKIFS